MKEKNDLIEENKEIKSDLRNVSGKLQDDYKRKQSLLLKISLIYLFTTSIILAIFLVASSSNQMSLIAEKAAKATDATAYGIFRRLEPVFSSRRWSLKPKSKKNKKSSREAIKLLKPFKESKQLIVSNFKIVSTQGNILYEYDSQLKKKDQKKIKYDQVTKTTLKKLKRAAKFKKLKGQLFLGIPNVKDYYIEIIIPIAEMRGNESVLFYTRINMAEMEEEVSSIMRLAYGLVILVFLSQIGLIYILYRILLIPIKSLAQGAHDVAEGNLRSEVPQLRQTDELGQLTYLFNKMVRALDERTTKLNLSIQELEKRNEMMQNELDMARNIQLGIMPRDSIFNNIEFSVYYGPLEKVSGDYYDFFTLPNGSLGILMTDASGHGVPAALVTIMAKVHFSNAVNRFDQPGDLLEHVNAQLVESIITSDYMTAFYMILSPDLKLRYSNASHQKAIIVRGKNILELDSGGFFIGAIEDVPFTYENKELQLQTKDRVILYTDGIVEGMNPNQEEYSSERFVKKIKEFSGLDVQTFKDKIIEDVNAFAKGVKRKDDYTLLVVEIK